MQTTRRKAAVRCRSSLNISVEQKKMWLTSQPHFRNVLIANYLLAAAVHGGVIPFMRA